MVTSFETIFQNAHRFSRNPLGIIALFLVLIYAIAGLVATNVASENPEVLSILIWFLVLFPIFVLVSFTYLVARHHQKLYAPSDFTDESNFMRSIDQGLARSERFAELEEVTLQIRREINYLPLFIFAKLPVLAQCLLKTVYLSNGSVNLNELRERFAKSDEKRAEYEDSIRMLNEDIGWIEIRENSCSLSDKGEQEVPSFIELTIGRIL